MHITAIKIIAVIIHHHVSFFVPQLGVSFWHLWVGQKQADINANEPCGVN